MERGEGGRRREREWGREKVREGGREEGKNMNRNKYVGLKMAA